MLPVVAIITDIPGATTPTAFIHDVLYSYARARVDDFIVRRGHEPQVAAQLDLVRGAAPDKPVLQTLLHWMDLDARVPALKALQDLIWHEGYAAGEIAAGLYPDVPDTLRSWHRRGVRLCTYSQASIAAQNLIFGHAPQGDLVPLFTGLFDTRVGAKRDHESYGRLTISLNLPPPEVLYLSAVDEELDAAAAAGLHTCQIMRDAEGATPSERHARAADFPAVANLVALGGTG